MVILPAAGISLQLKLCEPVKRCAYVVLTAELVRNAAAKQKIYDALR